MTQTEFIRRMVGVPWVRWAADLHECDCYGLVILYYRHVLGIDLGSIPICALADGFASSTAWREVAQPEQGACGFMSYRGDEPTHCGVYIGGGEVLHSTGSEEQPGNVRVTRVKSMELAYGKIRYYAHDLQ
jgi:cell wall-associated NlpC family hydrolase